MSCYNPRAVPAEGFRWYFKFFVPAAGKRIRTWPPLYQEELMTFNDPTFNDPTLYGRDEEEEFGDSGAYTESLEEDFEEEEEEEEEAGLPEPALSEPVVSAPPP